MLEIKTLLGTWKSVTREEAEKFYIFFNNMEEHAYERKARKNI